MKAVWAMALALLLCAGCLAGPQSGSPPDDGAPTGSTTTQRPSGSVDPPPASTASTVAPGLAPSAPAAPSIHCIPAEPAPVTALATVDPQGYTRISVPLDVVLVGFPADMAPRLQQALPPATVPEIHALQPALGQSQVPQALEATVEFHVRGMPDEVAAAFRAVVHASAEDPALLDGNSAEDALAALLRCSGVPLRADLPTMVIIHLGDDRVDDHLWMYRAEPKPEPDGRAGWLAGIRSFGGREPMIVLDASASKDPSPDRGFSGRGFEAPHALDDANLVDDLGEAVTTAASLRFFPRMVQPASLAACATLAIVYGIRAASLGDSAPMMLDPDRQIHGERIGEVFERLTGRPVAIDVRTVQLPAGDPEFEALTRLVGGAFVAYTGPETYTSLVGIYEPLPPGTEGARNQVLNAAVQAFGEWVDRGWAQQVQPGPGCEGYLGFMVWADGLDYPHNYGVGPSSPEGHRYVIGSMGVFDRYVADPGLGPSVYGQRQAAAGSYDIADPLFVHEFGHNMGLSHSHVGPGGPADWSFSSDRTTMSYRWQGLSAELGAIDEATIKRVRAGAAIHDAAERGVLDTPAGRDALAALDSWDWQRVADALLPQG